MLSLEEISSITSYRVQAGVNREGLPQLGLVQNLGIHSRLSEGKRKELHGF